MRFDDLVFSIQFYKNIERHTAHAIVSLPNPKQWQMAHTSNFYDNKIKYTYSHNHLRRNVWAEYTRPQVMHER